MNSNGLSDADLSKLLSNELIRNTYLQLVTEGYFTDENLMRKIIDEIISYPIIPRFLNSEPHLLAILKYASCENLFNVIEYVLVNCSENFVSKILKFIPPSKKIFTKLKMQMNPNKNFRMYFEWFAFIDN